MDSEFECSVFEPWLYSGRVLSIDYLWNSMSMAQVRLHLDFTWCFVQRDKTSNDIIAGNGRVLKAYLFIA